MPARRLTRRSLLAAGAGALAGGLVRPGGVLAALAGPPQPVRSERWIGELPAAGQTIALARNYELSERDLSRVLQLVADHEQEIRDAWQHHFGRGIVRSSSNFGSLGTPPTHPE